MAELESQLESHKQERYHMTSVVNANTGSNPVLTTRGEDQLRSPNRYEEKLLGSKSKLMRKVSER